jgi:hypothetical protein
VFLDLTPETASVTCSDHTSRITGIAATTEVVAIALADQVRLVLTPQFRPGPRRHPSPHVVTSSTITKSAYRAMISQPEALERPW